MTALFARASAIPTRDLGHAKDLLLAGAVKVAVVEETLLGSAPLPLYPPARQSATLHDARRAVAAAVETLGFVAKQLDILIAEAAEPPERTER